MKLQKYVEYWVEVVDEWGDIHNSIYQGNSKKEALKTASTWQAEDGFHLEMERVESWGNDEEGIVRRKFQDVDIETGKLGGFIKGEIKGGVVILEG